MSYNSFHNPECESCGEWQAFFDLVHAKIKALELECKVSMDDPISENTRMKRGGSLSAYRNVINILEGK